MNLRELAKTLELAPSTVSICLTGDPVKAKISPRTVDRVREKADKVGYVPNRFAQKIFRRGDDGVIGLLVKQDNALDRNMPILQAAMEQIGNAGREYVVQCCQEPQIVDTLRSFKGMKICHVILIGSLSARQLEGAGMLKDLEIFALDYRFDMPAGAQNIFRCRLGIDRAALYRKLAGTLADNGFAPFLCDRNCSVDTLLKDGLITPDRILDLPFRLGNYFEVGAAMADAVEDACRSNQARAMLLHNDQTAIGLCDALQKRGIRIPEDLALIGFNDSAFARYAAVPLTTVALPVLEHLRRVLDYLLNNEELPEEVKSVPAVICRDTTPESLNSHL